jgi:hypothetical protein
MGNMPQFSLEFDPPTGAMKMVFADGMPLWVQEYCVATLNQLYRCEMMKPHTLDAMKVTVQQLLSRLCNEGVIRNENDGWVTT